MTFSEQIQAWMRDRKMTSKQGQAWLGCAKRTWEDWQFGRAIPPSKKRAAILRALAGSYPCLPSDKQQAAERLLSIGDAAVLTHFLQPLMLGKTYSRIAHIDNKGTLSEIAQRYGLSAATVSVMLSRKGLKPTEVGRCGRPAPSKQELIRRKLQHDEAVASRAANQEKSKTEKLANYRAMRKSGKPLRQIADCYGVSVASVFYFLKRNKNL